MKVVKRGEDNYSTMKGFVALATTPFFSSWEYGVGLSIVTDTLTSIASAFQDPIRWAEAAQFAKKLSPEVRAGALSRIASVGAKIAGATDDTALWARALALAEGIVDAGAQAQAFRDLAVELALLARNKNDTALWARALEVAFRIKGPESARVTVEYASPLFFSVLYPMDQWSQSDHRSDALSTIAGIAAEMAEWDNDKMLLDQALRVSDSVRTPYFRSRALGKVAQRAARIAERQQDTKLLAMALDVAERVTEPFDKAQALGDIAEVAAGLDGARRAGWLCSTSRTAREQRHSLVPSSFGTKAVKRTGVGGRTPTAQCLREAFQTQHSSGL